MRNTEAIDMEEYRSAGQTISITSEGEKHTKALQARCCDWVWRICKRPRSMDGFIYGNTNGDTGTEFLRRFDQ
jgi:hypothetical protein